MRQGRVVCSNLEPAGNSVLREEPGAEAGLVFLQAGPRSDTKLSRSLVRKIRFLFELSQTSTCSIAFTIRVTSVIIFLESGRQIYINYYNVNRKMTQILLNPSKSNLFQKSKNTLFYTVTL